MKIIHQRFTEFIREYGNDLWLFSLSGIARKIHCKSISDISCYFTKAYGMNFRKLSKKENWQSLFRVESLIDRRAETNRRRIWKRSNRILLLLVQYAAQYPLSNKTMGQVAENIGVNYFTLHNFIKRSLHCGWKQLRREPGKYLKQLKTPNLQLETHLPDGVSGRQETPNPQLTTGTKSRRPASDPAKYPRCKDCGLHYKGRYVGKNDQWQCIYCGEIAEKAKLKYSRTGIPGEIDIELARINPN